ncbi:MAG: hypothetical protein HKO87_02810 [Acidimicrobiia bacterium]|nr:hypothetical protein [Acidimicrobiia bacterium]
MLWTVAGAKGGVGTTVIAAALALECAREHEVLLVDLAGDQADLLGAANVAPTGVWDWLAAGDDVGPDALDRVTIDVAERVRLLPAGTSIGRSVRSERAVQLADMLAGAAAESIVDIGVAGTDPLALESLLMASAGRRILVVRACYLALRRAQRMAVGGHDIVEVHEGGRALSTIDIEGVLGRPVAARVDIDPAIARVADAGLLTSRTPRRLRRMARDLAAVGHSSARSAS